MPARQDATPATPAAEQADTADVEHAAAPGATAASFDLSGIPARAAGPAMPFPHAGRINQALGTSLAFDGVLDPAGCLRRGTPAFTVGQVTHFASRSPGFHVAAHEAVHQLQHAGLTREAGLGPERHANAVADALSRGRPARNLIGRRGETVSPAVRNYVLSDRDGNWKPGNNGLGRVSETGETLTQSSHEAFATPQLIEEAANVLKAKHAGIALWVDKGAAGKNVEAPDGSGTRQLAHLGVTLSTDPSGQNYYSDCRQAARNVMGPVAEQEKASANLGGQERQLDPAGGPLDNVALLLYLDKKIKANPDYDTLSPADKDAFIRKTTGEFNDLDDAEKDKLKKDPVNQNRARELGIDQYVKPDVGEGYAVYNADKPGVNAFFFHYAGVIMAPGSDRVTLENEGGGKDEMSTQWKIETYGTVKPRQSFQEEWTGLGPDRHTLLVRNQPKAPADLGKLPGTSTVELLRRHRNSKDAGEKHYLEQELAGRRMTVTVSVNRETSMTGSDQVYLSIGSGFESEKARLSKGMSTRFSVPLSKLLPMPDPLTVRVKQYNLLGSDDLIGSSSWADPYDPQISVSMTGAGADYDVNFWLK